MAKYSDKFKLHIVREYLKGTLGYSSLAKKYCIPNIAQIQRWVRAYKAFGEEGLRKKQSKQIIPVQLKLDVLHFMKQTGASYQDTAIAFNMNNPTLIANWYRIFSRDGIEGLKEKGRSSMSKNRKAKSIKPKNELSREEQLERENELLRLENAYLKKLNAFQKDPNAFLVKHKQQWHSNSKKKDSN
jgi:transposase